MFGVGLMPGRRRVARGPELHLSSMPPRETIRRLDGRTTPSPSSVSGAGSVPPREGGRPGSGRLTDSPSERRSENRSGTTARSRGIRDIRGRAPPARCELPRPAPSALRVPVLAVGASWFGVGTCRDRPYSGSRLHGRCPSLGGSECPTPTGSTLGRIRRCTLRVVVRESEALS